MLQLILTYSDILKTVKVLFRNRFWCDGRINSNRLNRWAFWASMTSLPSHLTPWDVHGGMSIFGTNFWCQANPSLCVIASSIVYVDNPSNSGWGFPLVASKFRTHIVGEQRRPKPKNDDQNQFEEMTTNHFLKSCFYISKNEHINMHSTT